MIRSEIDRVRGLVFDIDTFAVHDGPGIRMAVYFKGCPLRCTWCHSPESQDPPPELVFVGDRCRACGACGAACPSGVHEVDAEGHRIDRARCQVCGRCVERCPYDALHIKGRTVSAGEIVARARRLRPFFEHSGGGVTLGGGEVTAQADFAAAVLAGCRAEGIHTALYTAGCCAWETLERLVALSDLVLYDLKLIDDDLHRRHTGASNAPVLDNARRLSGRNVEIRVPLIPALTDTEANLQAILDFLTGAGLARVAFLPYNPSSAAKYEWLGRRYPIRGEPQSREDLARLVERAEARGIEAVVG